MIIEKKRMKLRTFNAKVKALLKNGEIKVLDNVFLILYADTESWYEPAPVEWGIGTNMWEIDDDIENVEIIDVEAEDEEIEEVLEIIDAEYEEVYEW